MKMKRSELKALVKECLIEILEEGIISSSAPTEEHPQQKLVADAALAKRSMRKRQRSRRRPVVESIDHDGDGERQYINEVVGGLTDDPLMSTIFADTASTTVKEQASRGHSGPSRMGDDGIAAYADSAAEAMAGVGPDEVFERAGDWSKIAFAGMPPQEPPSSPAAASQKHSHDPSLDIPVTEIVQRGVGSSVSAHAPPIHFDPYAPVDSEIVG